MPVLDEKQYARNLGVDVSVATTASMANGEAKQNGIKKTPTKPDDIEVYLIFNIIKI